MVAHLNFTCLFDDDDSTVQREQLQRGLFHPLVILLGESDSPSQLFTVAAKIAAQIPFPHLIIVVDTNFSDANVATTCR